MARLYDGKSLIEITMNTWTGDEHTPDWSEDFFMVGDLEYNEDVEAYEVEDTKYCIEQAEDWQNMVGDYYGDTEPDGVEHCVEAYELMRY